MFNERISTVHATHSPLVVNFALNNYFYRCYCGGEHQATRKLRKERTCYNFTRFLHKDSHISVRRISTTMTSPRNKSIFIK